MSSTSPKHSFPYIQANQAQKHVTHNEAIRTLDTVVQLSVIATDQTSPPADPAPGDAYIVASLATGDWDGFAGQIAVWDENHWRFFIPLEGWVAWDAAAGAQVVYTDGAWALVQGDMQNLDMVGINTTADLINRLAVASDASLFTHDAAGDHRMKINKADATDTASLLFQTGWSGRAEMGTAGTDDFEIKVSPDGSTFHQGLVVDHTTGAVSFPNTRFTVPEFGEEHLCTVDYIASKGTDLVTNGTGLLQNNYNFPSLFDFDGSQTPNLPGAFSYAGRYVGAQNMTEFLSVDPNKPYRLGCYVYQDSVPGDWSAFTNGERHQQYLGILCYDADKQPIYAQHHMRYFASGVDSLTTLAAPLTPGDTIVHLADASGWNDTSTAVYNRGISILAYKNSFGMQYTGYSRLLQTNLFDLSGVDKAANTITLTQPFSAGLANPDDANGTWPVGTPIANTTSGGTYKYSLLAGQVLASTDQWYSYENTVAGVDTSGTNYHSNFAPGTAFVRVIWLPNFSSRIGGYGAYPDTGPDHKIRFSGVSLRRDDKAVLKQMPNKTIAIKRLAPNFDTGAVGLVANGVQIKAI